MFEGFEIEGAEAVFRSRQRATLGSNTPMPSRPSPFQSPTTGTGAPNTNVPTSASPADAVERNDHVAVAGAKAPIPEAKSFRFSRDSMDGPRPTRRDVFDPIFALSET